MKQDNINYLLVGSFVLLMMVLLFIILYQITGRTGPSDTYYVSYANVTGVKYGTPVLYEGYQIGQVELTAPKREGGTTRYVLTLTVERDWAIPADSTATLVASGLLAAITVEINEGTSQTLLKPGDFIESREAANIFTAVNDVAGELQDLSRNSLKPLISNLNDQINALGTELNDLTHNSIRPLIDNINNKLNEQALDDMLSLLSKLNQSADQLLLVLDADNQENLDQFLVNMKTASVSLNDMLSRIEETRVAMGQLLADADGLVVDNRENLKTSVEDLHKTMETISQNINAIVYHMEGSTRNLHELTRQLRENPALIIKSSPQSEEETNP